MLVVDDGDNDDDIDDTEDCYFTSSSNSQKS